MIQVDEHCKEYYEETLEFARGIGKIDQLQEKLDYLDNYAGRENTTCLLRKDFAPYSFVFALMRGDKHWFTGGLIFHGSHDNGGDGGAPTFSVNVSPVDGWAIHT